jgi:hypothetical protein
VTRNAILAADAVEVEDSLEAALEIFERNQWTDGLPIVPPTEKRVLAMLDVVKRDPQEGLGILAPSGAEATVELAAINAVMAGCKPAYFPVVVAAIEAIADPAFNLGAIQGTNNPATTMIIVNGPIAKELEINSAGNCFGQGWRTNLTIGRALRLVCQNIGGGQPQVTDLAVHGQPGKIAFCFAENESESRWEPLHVERGYAADQSTVTVVGAVCVVNIIDGFSMTPEGLLTTFAHSMDYAGQTRLGRGGELMLVLCPYHAQLLADAGWSKNDAKRWLHENARIGFNRLAPGKVEDLSAMGFSNYVPLSYAPEAFVFVVAGGPGTHAAYIPTFGRETKIVTRPINRN